VSSSERYAAAGSSTTGSERLEYHSICSEHDLPRSVAVSATGCVAFGCKGGVELYWVGNKKVLCHMNRMLIVLASAER